MGRAAAKGTRAAARHMVTTKSWGICFPFFSTCGSCKSVFLRLAMELSRNCRKWAFALDLRLPQLAKKQKKLHKIEERKSKIRCLTQLAAAATRNNEKMLTKRINHPLV